jgi:hypothetical protein
MFIIQVKHDPNMENFVDMAEEEEPAAAKQRMKQLVGEYQSEGRIVEVKAEAKMQYSDYFDQDQVEKVPEEKIAKAENTELGIPLAVNVPEKFIENQRKLEKQLERAAINAFNVNEQEETEKINEKDSPCMRDICRNYDDGECESFDDINDPIINSEGRCQGFDSIFKINSDDINDLSDGEKEIIDVMLNLAKNNGETPTLSQVVDQGIKRHEVYKHFNGYKEACKIAGLEVNSGGRK